MKLILTFATIIFCSHAFAQKPTKVLFPPPVLGMEYPDFTNACELLSRKNQLVYTRFIYSGTDEYWALRPEKHCVEINAELNIPDSVILKAEDIANITAVHSNYSKEYLVIDVIGSLEEANPNGYGHLGSNKYRFTVKYFVDSFLYRKRG